MYNILLDRLPYSYEGYLINADFRIGLQINMCLNDKELTCIEQTNVCSNLLYGRGMPPVETAIKGINWFMSCGNEGKKPKKQYGDKIAKPDFDFEIDSSRIQAGFRKVFGIDLKSEKMHWFDFIPLLNELRECCFSDVIGIRTKDTSKMSAKDRLLYNRLKREYAIDSDGIEEQCQNELKEIFNLSR